MLKDRNERLDEANEKICTLSSELAKLRAEVATPSSSSALKLIELQQKTQEMELRFTRRTIELQSIADRVDQRARAEVMAMKQKHDAAIAAKNNQIRQFRRELDALLNAMQGAGMLAGKASFSP